ncbi:MAG: hypothetical protein QW587_08935 [Candidatus Bathyarchaeia archaeon]
MFRIGGVLNGGAAVKYARRLGFHNPRDSPRLEDHLLQPPPLQAPVYHLAAEERRAEGTREAARRQGGAR